MITSFAHKGLERFYKAGSKAGIQVKHSERLRLILAALDAATGPADLSPFPSFRLHELKGERKGQWAITVQANWRVTFRFVPPDVELVNYEDYH